MSANKVVACLLGVVIVACGGVFTDGDGSGAPALGESVSPAAAMDRLPVVDSNGLDRPLDAYTLLLPRGWTSEGDVTWLADEPCFVASIRQRVTSTSPDQLWRLDALPSEEWDWPEDAKTQAMLQQRHPDKSWGCPIAPPLDAATFLAGPMARQIGGELTAIDVPAKTLSALQQQLLKTANESNAQTRAPVQSVSAAVGTVRFPDGSVGVALATVLTTVSTLPGPTKGTEIRVVASQAMRKYVLRVPAGHDAEGRELLDATASSVSVNPEWIAAVRQKAARTAAASSPKVASPRTPSSKTRAAYSQPIANGQKVRRKPWAFVQKLTGGGQQGGQQPAQAGQPTTQAGWQAMQEAQQYSADLQQQAWEAQQASQDRMFKAADQTIRDVESWEDPTTGNEVELQYGYNNAWSDGTGTYVQSTDVTFDPNAQLDAGSWQPLEKPAEEE